MAGEFVEWLPTNHRLAGPNTCNQPTRTHIIKHFIQKSNRTCASHLFLGHISRYVRGNAKITKFGYVFLWPRLVSHAVDMRPHVSARCTLGVAAMLFSVNNTLITVLRSCSQLSGRFTLKQVEFYARETS